VRRRAFAIKPCRTGGGAAVRRAGACAAEVRGSNPLIAGCFGDSGPWVAVGGVQPSAAEIEMQARHIAFAPDRLAVGVETAAPRVVPSRQRARASC
jgi:hypothetical protein